MNQENEKMKIMGGLVLIILIMGVSYIIYPSFRRNEGNVDKTDQQIPLDYDSQENIVKMESETSAINEDGENLNYTVGALYPKIILKNKNDQNEKKAERANFVIEDHLKKMIEDFKETVRGIKIDGATKHVFYGEYYFNHLDPDFFSLKFNISEYISGAAHPTNYVSILNYNLKEDKEINFKDIFKNDADYLTAVSTISVAKLLQKSQDDPSSVDWIKKGAAPEGENYANFGLNKRGIVIYFNPYQVGPYAAGIQEIEIPYADLISYLNPNSIIGGLLVQS